MWRRPPVARGVGPDRAPAAAAMPQPAPGARIALVLLAAALLADGCGIHGLRRTEVAPGALATAPRERSTLKAHLRDGGVIVFSDWTLEEGSRTVHGTGRLLDAYRQAGPERSHRVAVDSVALFESDERTVPGPMAAITMMTAVHGVMTAFCASNPKACFGSCPTFHASDGARDLLVAEGFSASVAPALEATDLDALDRVVSRDGRLVLTVTNEALETHVVRGADLLVAARPAGGRVLADAEGRLWRTGAPRAPDSAAGEEGDCRAALAARDAAERTSLSDPADLAARETIELRFAEPPAGRRGLVLVARQSLLSTWVFYQALAWMGRSAGTWLASFDREGAGTRERVSGPARALGGIEVQVRGDGGWRTVGEFLETGPLASDTRLVALPEGGEGPLDVRLRLTRGLWRVDQAALVAVEGEAEAARVAPGRVLRRGRPDAAALASLRGGPEPLVTMPGDTLALEYELPLAAGEVELFLQSRGYYLEWMRDAWLAEEDPASLAGLFLDPHGSLRRMAPAFKRVEPGMEAQFWGSRYAR